MQAVRAYSTLAVKSFSEEEKGFRFAGLATSPVADRASDRIDPLGAKYRNPVCLLRAHDHLTPIGECNFGRPTKAGITFDARIPKIDEPGMLKDRLEMAAQEVRSGLMRGVSIGFRPTKPPTPNELGGFDYPSTEIFELSTCAVPMHQLATIDQIKAIDTAIRSGEAPPTLPPPAGLWATISREGLMALNEFDASAERKELGNIMGPVVSATQSTQRMIKALCNHIDGLERRLEEQGSIYKGVWKEDVAYPTGSFVTFNGSMWHADKLTAFKPGEGGGWTLAVKRGRDGKGVA